MARIRRIFLYPEASQVLATLLPELDSHILAPHQLLAVTFPTDEVEESGFGLWVPAPEMQSRHGAGRAEGGRVLLPWRFVATMYEYDDPDVTTDRHHPIGFSRAERVG
ncbi:MAG: hypothetical protein K6V73_04790 [Firmicutes bacterium]|nr:hypothetical protein [Bacillota bacterium]